MSESEGGGEGNREQESAPMTEWLDFFMTAGRNDDKAVIATENLFFALKRLDDLATAARLLTDGLEPRPAAILLARIWHSGRPDLLDVGAPHRLIVPLFRRAVALAPDVLMGRDYSAFQGLPKTLTIYRGSAERRADHNPSWTLDPQFAARFAMHYSQGSEEPRVFVATITRTSVLAYFNLCGEREVVVDPAGLSGVDYILADWPYNTKAL